MNLFERAAQVLSERGHAKHCLEDPTGRVCAMGALNMADHGRAQHAFEIESSRVQKASDKAGMALHARGIRHNLYPESNLIDWNNAPETTGEDVILLFKELAAEDD